MQEDFQAAMDLRSTSGMLTFVHITYSHLTPTEVVETRDIKSNVPGVKHHCGLTFCGRQIQNLREKLQKEGIPPAQSHILRRWDAIN